MAKNFGLFDTVDKLWLGDETGPRLFGGDRPLPGNSEKAGQPMGDDAAMFFARCAAQVMDKRLGWAPGRTRAMEYVEKNPRIADELDTQMSTREALQRMADGEL